MTDRGSTFRDPESLLSVQVSVSTRARKTQYNSLATRYRSRPPTGPWYVSEDLLWHTFPYRLNPKFLTYAEEVFSSFSGFYYKVYFFEIKNLFLCVETYSSPWETMCKTTTVGHWGEKELKEESDRNAVDSLRTVN